MKEGGTAAQGREGVVPKRAAKVEAFYFPMARRCYVITACLTCLPPGAHPP